MLRLKVAGLRLKPLESSRLWAGSRLAWRGDLKVLQGLPTAGFQCGVGWFPRLPRLRSRRNTLAPKGAGPNTVSSTGEILPAEGGSIDPLSTAPAWPAPVAAAHSPTCVRDRYRLHPARSLPLGPDRFAEADRGAGGDFTAQHLVPVLRHPDQMVLHIPYRVGILPMLDHLDIIQHGG